MPRLSCLLLASVITVILVGPGVAVAQDCKAPPGTAAIDQYCETVPSGSGGSGAKSGKPASPTSLSRRTSKALARAGSDGATLAQAIGAEDARQPARDKSSGGRRSAGTGSKLPITRDTEDSASSGQVGAVRAAVGSRGIGDSFGWVLLAATLLTVGIAWMRYRRRSA